MLNKKKFIKKIIWVLFSVAILLFIGYKFISNSYLEAAKSLNITDFDTENIKYRIIWLYMYIAIVFLNIVLIERVMLIGKSKILNFIVAIVLFLAKVFLIINYFGISADYRYVISVVGVNKVQFLFEKNIFWFELIFSVYWYWLIKMISQGENSEKKYIFEKMYKFIRTAIWMMEYFVLAFFVCGLDGDTATNYLPIYENQNNLYINLIVLGIIFAVFIITYFVIYLNVKKIKKYVNRRDIQNKELIIYHNPIITSIPLERQINFCKRINIEKIKKIGLFLIEDGNSVFIDYRLVINNVIDYKKFKNRSHVFEFNTDIEEEIDKTYIENFVKLIEQYYESKEKFIIVNTDFEEDENGILTKQLKNKYYYSYITDNENWYRILTQIDKDVDKEIKALVNNISDNDSSKYIKETLEVLEDSLNNIEKFYQFIKLCEYMIHYEALYNISVNKLYETENTEEMKKVFRNPTIGTWNEFQLDNTNSYNSIKETLKEIGKIISITIPSKVTLLNLKELIAKIKNENLGHGSVSYYISKKYNRNLVKIVKILIEEFDKKNLNLKDKVIIDKDNDQIPLLIEVENDEYIYCNKIRGIKEYICYSTGKIIKQYKSNAEKIVLDLGEDEIYENK